MASLVSLVCSVSFVLAEELQKVTEWFQKEKKEKQLAEAAQASQDPNDSGAAQAAAEAGSETERSPAAQRFLAGRACKDEGF